MFVDANSLLVRRAWGAHPCRLRVWRELHKAGLLHLLDFEDDQEDDDEVRWVCVSVVSRNGHTHAGF